MAKPFKVRRITHVIHACNDYHAVRQQYLKVFPTLVWGEGYQPEADRDMNLFYAADFGIEPMAPRRTPGAAGQREGANAMAHIFSDYVDRYGEGWHSFEVAVEDLPGTIEQLKADGIRISPGVPFTHPRDAFGFCIEMVPWTGLRGDPGDLPGWNSRWFEGNALGLQGFGGLVHIVDDVDAACNFLVGTWGARVERNDSVDEPEPLKRVQLELGGSPIMLVQPTGNSGPVTDTLDRRKLGIYSLAWRVKDLKQAQARLQELGVKTEAATGVMGGVSIDVAAMHGARHELYEG